MQSWVDSFGNARKVAHDTAQMLKDVMMRFDRIQRRHAGVFDAYLKSTLADSRPAARLERCDLGCGDAGVSLVSSLVF